MIRLHHPLTASVLIPLCVLGTLFASASVGRAQEQTEFVDLFDGKSLEGFEQKGGKADYQVEDGCIVGTTVPRTPNSFLCTEKHYGDFILEYEFLVDEKMNSGVQIRSHSIPGYRKGRVHARLCYGATGLA